MKTTDNINCNNNGYDEGVGGIRRGVGTSSTDNSIVAAKLSETAVTAVLTMAMVVSIRMMTGVSACP